MPRTVVQAFALRLGLWIVLALTLWVVNVARADAGHAPHGELEERFHAAVNQEILQGWLHSPIHRENLHAPPFNRTGIGIARAANGTWYYTQLNVTFPR